jgi:drug/metabolite transporter (DMT)-like permease
MPAIRWRLVRLAPRVTSSSAGLTAVSVEPLGAVARRGSADRAGYAPHWLRCDGAGSGCAEIPPACGAGDTPGHAERSSLPPPELVTGAEDIQAPAVPTEPELDRAALTAFAGAVVIGGSNYVAVRFSNRELDPLWGAALRFLLAAAVFAILCAALRLSLPRGRPLALVLTYGLLSFGAAYGCMYWAMKEVPAGVAAVVFAIGPLLTLLFAVAHRMERLGGRAIVGALVAIVGSALMFSQPESVSFGWTSFALLVLAAAFASESVVVSKLAGAQHPVAMNFVGMTAGAVVLLAVAVAAGESLVLPRDGETQVALVYLVAATVALFVLVLVVVRHWTASATSYIFVLMPVVAIAVGALLADEPITASTVAGGALVCAGVYVGAARRD